MFRLKQKALPKDPTLTASLKCLGLFINSNDQLRQIADPQKDFVFCCSQEDRVNDIRKGTYRTVLLEIVLKRLRALGLEDLRVPLGASETEPHIPILVSKDLSSRKHIIVYVGDTSNELGILSHTFHGRVSIAAGSMISAVKHLNSLCGKQKGDGETQTADGAEKFEDPGLVIANPAQLIWHRGKKKTLSSSMWEGLPRQSAFHPSATVDSERNKVPGNEDIRCHIAYVLENVVAPTNAKISIIGVREGAYECLTFLRDNWENWRDRMNAMALCQPFHYVDDIRNVHDYHKFLKRRGRVYLACTGPLDEPAPGFTFFGFNCYVSSEPYRFDRIFALAHTAIFSFFKAAAEDPNYSEPALPILGDEF